MRTNTYYITVLAAALLQNVDSFSVSKMQQQATKYHTGLSLSASVESTEKPATVKHSFIEEELRGTAMRLHTRSQAPKEGKAEEKPKPKEPYTPTHADYLAFLVDSQHIYKAFEQVVNESDELAVYRNTGLERVEGLETDINFMIMEYNLERPPVGKPGLTYADEILEFGKEKKIPELLCHYYNYYFAHTAGGRMIGKQMSALLLEKKTLEFYKVSLFLCGHI